MSSIIVQSTVMRPPVSPQPSPPSSPTTKRPLSPSAAPDQDSSSPNQNGDSNKRRRLSSDQARGKRMFGALMGTLTSFQKQTSARSKQVERRAEIDARVKERVKKEKEVMDAEKEKGGKERRRKEEQVKLELETETVRLQNSLELARAGHLFTKEATPKIYYRPYLLLPEQKTLIEQQIAQAQAQIEEKEQGTAIQRRDSVEEDDGGDRRVVNERQEESQSPKEGDEEVVVEEEEERGG